MDRALYRKILRLAQKRVSARASNVASAPAGAPPPPSSWRSQHVRKGEGVCHSWATAGYVRAVARLEFQRPVSHYDESAVLHGNHDDVVEAKRDAARRAITFLQSTNAYDNDNDTGSVGVGVGVGVGMSTQNLRLLQLAAKGYANIMRATIRETWAYKMNRRKVESKKGHPNASAPMPPTQTRDLHVNVSSLASRAGTVAMQETVVIVKPKTAHSSRQFIDGLASVSAAMGFPLLSLELYAGSWGIGHANKKLSVGRGTRKIRRERIEAALQDKDNGSENELHALYLKCASKLMLKHYEAFTKTHMPPGDVLQYLIKIQQLTSQQYLKSKYEGKKSGESTLDATGDGEAAIWLEHYAKYVADLHRLRAPIVGPGLYGHMSRGKKAWKRGSSRDATGHTPATLRAIEALGEDGQRSRLFVGNILNTQYSHLKDMRLRIHEVFRMLTGYGSDEFIVQVLPSHKRWSAKGSCYAFIHFGSADTAERAAVALYGAQKEKRSMSDGDTESDTDWMEWNVVSADNEERHNQHKALHKVRMRDRKIANAQRRWSRMADRIRRRYASPSTKSRQKRIRRMDWLKEREAEMCARCGLSGHTDAHCKLPRLRIVRSKKKLPSQRSNGHARPGQSSHVYKFKAVEQVHTRPQRSRRQFSTASPEGNHNDEDTTNNAEHRGEVLAMYRKMLRMGKSIRSEKMREDALQQIKSGFRASGDENTASMDMEGMLKQANKKMGFLKMVAPKRKTGQKGIKRSYMAKGEDGKIRLVDVDSDAEFEADGKGGKTARSIPKPPDDAAFKRHKRLIERQYFGAPF